MMSVVSPGLMADMLREALERGQNPGITISSDSMAPLLRRGDLIRLAAASPDTLLPGEVIVVRAPADLLTHRYWGALHGSDGAWLLTRGDRQRHFDALTPARDLVGRVVARERGRRRLLLISGLGGLLDRHLARLAALEIRLFAAGVQPPGGGESLTRHGRFAGSRADSLFVRLVRRAVFTWARLWTAVFGLFARPESRGRG
jgi:hypothetical protein